MPAWDADDCVAVFREEAGIADSTDITDVEICTWLSRAQQKVIGEIAARAPESLYQAPTALTTADGGKTFTFGTDGNSNPIVPMGWVQLATSLSAFIGQPYFVGWVEGRDYFDEGTQIRLTSNRNWTGTLYGRFVPTPPDIDSASTPKVSPVLNPTHHRNLIVLRAAADWAAQGGARPNLAATKYGQYKNEFRAAMTTYRTRYKGGGAILPPGQWYLAAPDLGNTGTR